MLTLQSCTLMYKSKIKAVKLLCKYSCATENKKTVQQRVCHNLLIKETEATKKKFTLIHELLSKSDSTKPCLFVFLLHHHNSHGKATPYPTAPAWTVCALCSPSFLPLWTQVLVRECHNF